MQIRSSSLMEYDQQGDLHITIPRSVLKKFEESLLYQAISELQRNSTRKQKLTWADDSISKVIGFASSVVTDGAANHDSYLYSDHR